MKLSLLLLQGVPILDQLQIEEALLRADSRDICIINSEVEPAIVMGLSGKVEKLLHPTLVTKHKVPLIKRFSGGGTVYIDHNTLFVTFIFNAKKLNIAPFPHAIMKWSEGFYRPVFESDDFRLRENDYVFGERKFGGNAQYIQKERCLHHTSFLWDYDETKMEMLKLPEKRPTYRGIRSHADFLCRLKERYESKKTVLERLLRHLQAQFDIDMLSWNEAKEVLALPHRKSTQQL